MFFIIYNLMAYFQYNCTSNSKIAIRLFDCISLSFYFHFPLIPIFSNYYQKMRPINIRSIFKPANIITTNCSLF